MLFVIFIGLICLALSAYFFGETVTLPARQRKTSVRRAANYGAVRAPLTALQRPFGERVLNPLGERLARWTLKLHPKTTVEGVSARLLAAGLGRSISANTFLALKSGSAIVGVALGAIFGGAAVGDASVLFFSLVLAALRLHRARLHRLQPRPRAEGPDPRGAAGRARPPGRQRRGRPGLRRRDLEADRAHGGPAADEFALTLSEIRIGESRPDALKKLADACDTPELSAFVRAIIQADQLGISLGRILRVQATDTRLRRQAAAEEKAMKAPIKMLFPTVLFIFPAMFLVILGPAFLNLSKIF